MPPDPLADTGFRRHRRWLLAVLAVGVGQAGLALRLFGGWDAVTDDRPVVSGRHPLHLYHAAIGADTFRRRNTTACYDPAFQAGYPKTPVFDGGCRPAEVALYLAGGRFDPAAYKLGLLALCLAVPWAFAVAGRGAGLCAPGCAVAAALGCGVWWSPPVRGLLAAGDVDLLLAGLAAVVFVPWLSRYNWDPGPLPWAVLAAAAVVGWYAHPVVWLGVTPVFAVYYLAVAPRHGPAWHLGLVGVTLVGLGPNLWWLWDWGKFWWLRQPSAEDMAPLPNWGALLGSWAETVGLFGPPPFGWPLVAVGVVGLAGLLRGRCHTAPAVLLVGGALAVLVGRLGQTWSPLVSGGADRAGPLAAALAVLPAAWLLQAMAGGRGRAVPAVACTVLVVGACGLCPLPPLPLGLTADQQAFARGLSERTKTDARILLEDADRTDPAAGPWNWTALLPELTGRVYLGGLDPDACFEHAYVGLRSGRLNGRRLDDWSDRELDAFCRRYNVGWVACRTPASADRWRRVPGAKAVGRYRDGAADVVLFELARARSYVLYGAARWEQADRRKVVLTDVEPAEFPSAGGHPQPDRVVVLSLHHQDGLRVSPNSVQVDRDPDPFDPIPMVRLRMAGPVTRVVLSWDNP
jgi:hypothetical protein